MRSCQAGDADTKTGAKLIKWDVKYTFTCGQKIATNS